MSKYYTIFQFKYYPSKIHVKRHFIIHELFIFHNFSDYSFSFILIFQLVCVAMKKRAWNAIFIIYPFQNGNFIITLISPEFNKLKKLHIGDVKLSFSFPFIDIIHRSSFFAQKRETYYVFCFMSFYCNLKAFRTFVLLNIVLIGNHLLNSPKSMNFKMFSCK